MFLHTSHIGQSSGHNVVCRSRGKKDHSILPAPQSQRDYKKHFHAVNRNDRDSADYTVSLRTNCWYLWLLFWLVDWVVHLVYASVIFCVHAGICDKKWRRYKRKNGQYDLQIDPGIEITNYAIKNEWSDLSGPCPDWMPQTAWIPCECKKYFFCLNGLTSGIAHKTRTTVTTFVQHDNTRVKTKGCTDERVNLERGNQHCRQCYRKN